MKRQLARWAILWMVAWALPAQAHRPSDAYLTLILEDTRISGQWEIALRDLDAAFGVDANGDGALTWGELRGAQARLNDALRASLDLSAEGQACTLSFPDVQIHDRIEGRYAWFGLQAECPQVPARLGVAYRLLFALDPSHRGLLVVRGAQEHAAVLSPAQPLVEIEPGAHGGWRVFRDYLREGVHHIWIGLDHVLFLLILLLPCVLVRVDGEWRGVAHLRPALWQVVAVVTAFTAAHSVTLTLAVLGWVRLPAALVEPVIALSVLLTALNNLVPAVTSLRWALAFGFGLLHGFGFASVLGDLGLPDGLRALALLAFNLGVELGQLAIVVLAVPLTFALRNRWIYRNAILRAGSGVIALIALFWLLQRIGLLGN
jgi:hypothetical protein